jgi:hypothetical protein
LIIELVKCTPEDNEDYSALLKAKNEINIVTNYINSKIRLFDNRRKLIKIENRFKTEAKTKNEEHYDLIKPHRTFILDGVVSVKKLFSEVTFNSN